MSNPISLPEADSAADAAAAPMLDAEALRRLRELDPGGEHHVVDRVMRAFDTSLSRLMAQAEQARQQDDVAAIRHVVHTLKSSSASVGALDLAQGCTRIETQLREHPDADLALLVSELQHEGRRALAAVRALLTQSGASV